MSFGATENSNSEFASGSADWLSFSIGSADVADVKAQLQTKSLQSANTQQEIASVVERVQQLRIHMLGDPSDISDSNIETLVKRQDYDVLPRDYKIDWRFPIIGPIHGLVRRIVNDEIRRFLFPSLKQQSTLNRQLVDAIQELSDENRLLRTEISKLTAVITEEQLQSDIGEEHLSE